MKLFSLVAGLRISSVALVNESEARSGLVATIINWKMFIILIFFGCHNHKLEIVHNLNIFLVATIINWKMFMILIFFGCHNHKLENTLNNIFQDWRLKYSLSRGRGWENWDWLQFWFQNSEKKKKKKTLLSCDQTMKLLSEIVLYWNTPTRNYIKINDRKTTLMLCH